MITTKDNSLEVKQFLRRVPKSANAAMNRQIKRGMGEFAREFTKKELGRGGSFHVKSKRRVRPNPRGGIALPANMRRAGFVTRFENAKRIENKGAVIHTGNPLLLVREYGDVIRPKKAKALFIHGNVKNLFKGVRGAKAKRAAATSRRRRFLASARWGSLRRGSPITARVQSVYQPPVLGFRSAWRKFRPRMLERLREGVKDAGRRAQAQGRRRRG